MRCLLAATVEVAATVVLLDSFLERQSKIEDIPDNLSANGLVSHKSDKYRAALEKRMEFGHGRDS